MPKSCLGQEGSFSASDLTTTKTICHISQSSFDTFSNKKKNVGYKMSSWVLIDIYGN